MPTSIDKYLDPTGLDETVLNIRQLAEGLAAEMQNLPYARPDGIYPDMTVGAVIGADETAQWATRVTTGNGAATVRSVQGASVVWNQLAPALTANNYNAYQFSDVSFSDGVFTGTIDNTASTLYRNVTYTANHRYMMLVDVKAPAGVTVSLNFTYAGTIMTSKNVIGTGYFIRESVRYKPTDGPSGSNDRINLRNLVADNAGQTISAKNIQLFDLTAIFGTGNEPTTVAEFERMFPEPYYPYSAPTLKPVQIAGIESTDAQGGELDAIEWTAQTLRAAGSVADMLYSDHVDVRVGVVDLGTLSWNYNRALDDGYQFVYNLVGKANGPSNIRCAEYPLGAEFTTDLDTISARSNSNLIVFNSSRWGNRADVQAGLAGVMLYYGLATPTTQPISPALPMTYKVQQGGSESIIVPDGEVSAAPVLTVAEPVNAGDEFARIWEAIESLGYTRNAAQLSRPVSLTGIGSIDEVQKDTTDVVEIDTTKEVQE